MTTAETIRKTPKTPRPDLRFIFRTGNIPGPSPLLTLHADIAQQAALNHDGTVRTAYDEQRGTQPGGHGLRSCVWTGLAGEWDSFTLTAQAEPDSGWYGWRAEFRQPFSVGLGRAEAMVKVLRRLRTRPGPPGRPVRRAGRRRRVGGTGPVHGGSTRHIPPVRPGHHPRKRFRPFRVPLDGHRRPPLLARGPAS
jgi:hypothetical protein